MLMHDYGGCGGGWPCDDIFSKFFTNLNFLINLY